MKIPRPRILLLAALATAGCGASTPADAPASSQDAVCEEAAAHVQQCFPEAEIGAPPTCDPAQAAAILGRPCGELQAVDTGKADGACSPLLWWTWTSCLPSATPATPTLYVNLSTCESDICQVTYAGGSCALVTLEDTDGAEIARGFTNANSSAHFEGLPAGRYTARVWTRDGELTEQLVDDGGFSMTERAPAEQEIEIPDRGDSVVARFYFEPGIRETLQRCASIEGTVAGTCEGEPLDAEDVEWTWFVQVTGEDEAGPVERYARPFETFEVGNQYHISTLLPGSYTLSFVELELPASARRNNPDYAALVERYATGVTHTTPLEITLEDANSELSQGEAALEPSSCEE